jgi:hypothetical protein
VPPTEEELEEAARRCAETRDAIVNSDAAKKLIIAGPGTGKTYQSPDVAFCQEGDTVSRCLLSGGDSNRRPPPCHHESRAARALPMSRFSGETTAVVSIVIAVALVTALGGGGGSGLG